MPIRPEWRHLFQGPEWAAIRARILERAGNRCEQCGKPNYVKLQVMRGGYWFDAATNAWRDCTGESNAFCWPDLRPHRHRTIYTVRCVLTVAHLNHDPRDNHDENLRALCQHCRLKFECGRLPELRAVA